MPYSRLTLCLLYALTVAGQVVGEDRHPAVAGAFYPADSSALAAMVQKHLAQATDLPVIDGNIVALIVPHAGLVYSGAIAAHSYKLLEGSDVNRVILCGPSHRYPVKGASVYGPGVNWHTPLGTVECDNELCTVLAAGKGIDVVAAAHAREHSLEVQLPYLQSVLPDFTIVPVVVSYQDKHRIDMLATALEGLEYDSRTIMVASTDWQHFKPSSVGAPMDSLGIACLLDLDPDRLATLLASGRVEMCGGGVAVAVTRAALSKGANRAKLLRYGDSGDVSGDKQSVVGYAAVVLYRHSAKENDKTKQAPDNGELKVEKKEPYYLSASQKKRLLQIARQSIADYLKDGAVPEFEVTGILREPGAAFVTLEKQGRLRGCIGYTQAVEPLYRTVSSCAIKAAVEDQRFTPVQADELAGLHIEISVLTPLEETASLDEIEVGRDGLMIVMGRNRGLLLPQVAVDNGWDRDTFLEQTCRKAGLPPHAYKSPQAVILKFQAVIFGE